MGNQLITEKVGCASLEESNIFLRALWSTLRANFGSLGWNYTAHKIGKTQTIYLGWITIGESRRSIGVSVKYGRVGIIKEINFELPEGIQKEFGEIEEALRDCVSKALSCRSSIETRYFKTRISISPPVILSPYLGQNWSCTPIRSGIMEVSISVKSFDDPDGHYIAAVQLRKLLNTLSFMTNLSFDSVTNRDDSDFGKLATNQYHYEEDWIDDMPFFDGVVRLTKDQVEFCDDVVDGTTSDARITRAALLFHKSLKIYQRSGESDVAMTLSLSALEAVSMPLIKSETCDHCSQPVYKISQRVVDLSQHYMGDAVAKIIKHAYERRSKFLHVGHVVASQPRTHYLIPQLDPSGVEGCAMPEGSGNINNILEFTSFALRKILTDNKAKPIELE